jgi:hypothetical protein
MVIGIIYSYVAGYTMVGRICMLFCGVRSEQMFSVYSCEVEDDARNVIPFYHSIKVVTSQ